MPCCGALLWRLEGLGNQPFIHSVTVAFYPFDVGSYTLQTLLYSKLAGALVNVWSSEETRHLKAKMKSQFSRCCYILNCSRRSDCGYCAKRDEKEKQPCFRVFFFSFPALIFRTALHYLNAWNRLGVYWPNFFKFLFTCIYLHLLRITRKKTWTLYILEFQSSLKG